MTDSIAMDDTASIAKLARHGEKLGQMILKDDWEEMEDPLESIVMG